MAISRICWKFRNHLQDKPEYFALIDSFSKDDFFMPDGPNLRRPALYRWIATQLESHFGQQSGEKY